MAKIDGLRRTTLCFTDEQLKFAKNEARENGFKSASSFLRHLIEEYRKNKKSVNRQKKNKGKQ